MTNSNVMAPVDDEPGDLDQWKIALYYCYVAITDVSIHSAFQKALCTELQLTGRIRVAEEGLNGVLSGLRSHLIEYEIRVKKELLVSSSLLQTDGVIALDVKYCALRSDLPVSVQLFESLQVQVTSHVVCLMDEPKQHPKRGKGKKKIRSHADLDCVVRKLWNEVQANPSVMVPSVHLCPSEWNEHLASLTENDQAILLDCRNSYESAIGYFAAPYASTVLTNTRKYSELTRVFLEEVDRLASSSHIFMYCTGGVRCEKASAFLERLLMENPSNSRSTPKVFQLHGGIQRYLEHQHLQEDTSKRPLQLADSIDSYAGTSTNSKADAMTTLNCNVRKNYFLGKNFVFDPRRTDPMHDSRRIIGECLVCRAPHDDYDNGMPPSSGRGESRCVTCRVLLLVCESCRQTVTRWGQQQEGGGRREGDDDDDDNIPAKSKPLLYCGGVDGQCLHRAPARVVVMATDENVAV